MTFSPDDQDIRAQTAAVFAGDLAAISALCDSLVDRALIEATWHSTSPNQHTESEST